MCEHYLGDLCLSIMFDIHVCDVCLKCMFEIYVCEWSGDAVEICNLVSQEGRTYNGMRGIIISYGKHLKDGIEDRYEVKVDGVGEDLFVKLGCLRPPYIAVD